MLKMEKIKTDLKKLGLILLRCADDGIQCVCRSSKTQNILVW